MDQYSEILMALKTVKATIQLGEDYTAIKTWDSVDSQIDTVAAVSSASGDISTYFSRNESIAASSATTGALTV